MRCKFYVMLLFVGLIGSNQLTGQEKKKINWITFEQLNDSLIKNPKKVFIDFYADWCTPCHKMNKNTYTDQRIIEKLNSEYYAVKMNVETKDTVVFGEQVFVNKKINKPNPVHQIPLLMASRKNKPFSLPAIVITDQKFIATARYFQYLHPEQLMTILSQ